MLAGTDRPFDGVMVMRGSRGNVFLWVGKTGQCGILQKVQM